MSIFKNKFQYIEPGYKDEPVTITVNGWYISRMYYPYWCTEMRKVGKESQISLENCIEDFCVSNWATKL